ncbi:MAG: Sensor histidine kinase RcsC [Chroococcopsis gigantea SAG 12.99]|jgi:signal transduction histidine kinase/DNA-binding NarL/FixJ family response regulator|nr:Sensor histidine kinase RcsC [Chroococcopsis gigantea SAG 12.99]
MLRNLKLGTKFTILLTLVFLGSVVLSGVTLSSALHREAENEVTDQAEMLMQGMNAVRTYTSDNIQPILETELDTRSKFIRETVPAFAANQVFDQFRNHSEYQSFFYKEATINPTNPKDQADTFETDLIGQFRQRPDKDEISGYRSKRGKNFFFIARPLAVQQASCLECHGAVSSAPKSMLAIYGDKRGFNWHMNEVVAAQTIYVPVDEVVSRGRRYLASYMGIFVGIFSLMVVLINSLLKRSVIEPIRRLTEIARRVSTDGTAETELPAFESPAIKRIAVRNDEPGQLTRAFHYMAQEVATREKTLATAVQQRTAQLAESMKEAESAKAKAEAANKTKTQFLSHMNHELRTPLNVILGFTQLLARESGFDRQHRDYLDTISRSGEHLLTLINDVLEMSKIEAGRITLNESDFALLEMLNSLQRMLSLKAQGKGIELVVQLGADLPDYIHGDESKLRQVLLNLLTNAIKFTDEGCVTLGVRNDGLTLLFEVEDTGSGIAESEIDNLFEAFVQTETGRKSQEGTGLGLPISKTFVNLMGGDITVESSLGIGTVFRFTIPLQEASQLTLASRPGREVIGLKPGQTLYRILVVEDKLENRRLLVQLLTSVGFTVREAGDGEIAIALWRDWQPHLIWMDLRMPVLDGYATTKQIRKLEISSDKPKTIIIALTGSAFAESRNYALSIGCDDFVAKPFSSAEIFEKMAQYLQIDYIYKDERGKCDRPSLNGISPDWIEKLSSAAIRADSRQITGLIQSISTDNRDLATTLNLWLDDFDYEKILELIESQKPS